MNGMITTKVYEDLSEPISRMKQYTVKGVVKATSCKKAYVLNPTDPAAETISVRTAEKPESLKTREGAVCLLYTSYSCCRKKSVNWELVRGKFTCFNIYKFMSLYKVLGSDNIFTLHLQSFSYHTNFRIVNQGKMC